MTPVFCCGFECGQTGSVGQHWAALFTGSSISTTIKRNGERAGRINFTANNAGVLETTVTSSNIFVIRTYIYFTTLPTVSLALIRIDGTALSVGFKASDSKIYPVDVAAFTFGSAGFAITTNRWYMIDCKFNTSTNPHTLDVSVDGVSLTQQTKGVAGTSSTLIDIGVANTESGNPTDIDVYFDDFILSNTTGDYPIGNGAVRHFVPTSDGTHTATTTTIVKGTIATPVGANVAGNTDAFNWVNGVPLLGGASDNTRLINQQTAGTTLYAEVVFGPAPNVPTPRVAPRAVEVITADREATTASGDFTVKLNDNGTENTVFASGAAAGTVTDKYKRKHYATAPTGGAWTVVSGAGNFNNIRARFGYASDATPDQYWRGIMIEAEFADTQQKVVSINQAVNRSNTY